MNNLFSSETDFQDGFITLILSTNAKTRKSGLVVHCGGEGGKPGPCPTTGGKDHLSSLKAMYEGHADHDYAAIASKVSEIGKQLKEPEVKKLAESFGIFHSPTNTKAGWLDAIKRRITDRKASAERTAFGGLTPKQEAAAAKLGPSGTKGPDLVSRDANLKALGAASDYVPASQQVSDMVDRQRQVGNNGPLPKKGDYSHGS